MSVAVQFGSPSLTRGPRLLVLAALLWAAMVPMAGARAVDGTPVEHLVVSEVVTGGASASDEIIEIHNPAPAALPLEGLELIYVSASGATITRRAAWALGAPVVQPGGHVLVANEAGIFASVADATYAAGMATAGGSVALRVQGATSAIDAVGWGTAAGTWREGTNAVAPTAGASIERLPGGLLGSTQDTDDNVADFVERPMPEPQNLGSPPTPAPGDPPPTPTPIPMPTSTPTSTPTVEPTASPSPSATPAPISVAAARAAPDDAVVTVEGMALTASTFHDGGGFLADASGGIAVLLDEGSFARGDLLRVTGTVDDRFSQRTIRTGGTDVVSLGTGVEPAALMVATGSVSESNEGSLVRIAGFVAGSPTTLTTGMAFDIDDGTGSARVIVPTESGIDLVAWTTGARVDLIGVAAQRDSTGTGAEGYRVMPRDANDVVEVGGPTGSPPPSSSASPTPEPTATPGDPEGIVSISHARAAPKNARLRVRGVVTLAPGTVDPVTAAIQDATGAIVLRLGDEVGPLGLGERIEVAGTRSTKGGMETLRVTEVPLQLGMAAEPAPRPVHTGEVDESLEALLVVARGALVASARRASSGTVSFEIDDGSGPL
ncbi:MAG: lamin tail domain-containing protein, partial [Candidatus Limnocylindria bacterium]